MTTTDHPLTEDRAAEIWGDHAPSYLGQWRSMSDDRRAHAVNLLRVAHNAGREHEREHADPHHDPRPWQDCTRKGIRAGDRVEARDKDVLHVGVAHHQDADGDWRTKDDRLLTYGDHWPLRRIPAPTTPAEEVELPGKHPTHLTDVEHKNGDVCVYMALDNDGDWCGVNQQSGFCAWLPSSIAAFTLPDGTRARRDGDREDGAPRFVKVQEGEK